MPTYQYACTACGEQLEAVQSFSDFSLTNCPACGGLLRKVFSAVGVVFKGSGFYKTDSRAASSANASSGDSKTESKNESKSESKTDSKGDAKSPTVAGKVESSSAASSSSSGIPAAKTA